MKAADLPIDFSAILAARDRLAGRVHRTPVATSHFFDTLTGATLFFKCENLQRAGAFKIRGATNAVAALPDTGRQRGVITHSSGNHGQALALAAREQNVGVTVVMPRDTSAVKRLAVEGYGAAVSLCDPGTASREAAVARIVAATGAVLVHPYDDCYVIAGQGTAALELMEEVKDLDAVLAPVGGGGLLAGSALAASGYSPRTVVYGAEPEAADDAAQSLAAGRIMSRDRIDTVADGLRTNAVGKRNFALIKPLVRRIFTVSEAEIAEAMRLFWERLKLIIEPSSAVAVAALIRYREELRGQRVGIIISGGNVDLRKLPWL